MKAYRQSGKRGIDMLLVVVAAPLWIPLLAILATIVKVTLGSPVYFRQTRPGLNGRTFTILKFRTMSDAADPDGNVLPDAERLTRLGSFLRRSSLDEVPELLNVLRGEMSLVGPRPLLTDYLPLYSERQSRRHEVRPGLTGWAQVSGRNLTEWDERLERDVWYVENLSLKLDSYILAKTIPTILSRRGISQPGEATMRRFEG